MSSNTKSKLPTFEHTISGLWTLLAIHNTEFKPEYLNRKLPALVQEKLKFLRSVSEPGPDFNLDLDHMITVAKLRNSLEKTGLPFGVADHIVQKYLDNMLYTSKPTVQHLDMLMVAYAMYDKQHVLSKLMDQNAEHFMEELQAQAEKDNKSVGGV